MSEMSDQGLAEWLADRQVSLSLGLVLGVLIVVFPIVVTLLLQYWFKWIDLSQNLTDLWLWIMFYCIFAGFTLINVSVFRSRRNISTARPNQPLETASLLLSQKQVDYRKEVRADLVRIRSGLYNVSGRKDIQFYSWNETRQPNFHALKHDLIGKDTQQDKAIESFSSVLNIRNRNLNNEDFDKWNDCCIARYVEIRESGFFDLTLENPQVLSMQPESVEPLKEINVVILITRTGSGWFDIGVENGKLVDTGKYHVLVGKIDNKPISHGNYFTINHAKSASLKMQIKATFLLPLEHAMCVLRKADAGHLTVRLRTGHFAFSRYRFISWLSTDIGEKDYETSPNPKNETKFELRYY